MMPQLGHKIAFLGLIAFAIVTFVFGIYCELPTQICNNTS